MVPLSVFAWLELRALRAAEAGESAWLRVTQRRGRRAVQVTSFIGVIRAPDGFQIEVLPKVGKAIGSGDTQARQHLIEMLHCLDGFRHLRCRPWRAKRRPGVPGRDRRARAGAVDAGCRAYPTRRHALRRRFMAPSDRPHRGLVVTAP